MSFQDKPQILQERNQIKVKYRETFPGLSCNALTDSSQCDLRFYFFYLLALVESSLEVLLMLALLSRFFLQSVSLCLVWLEEGGDEEELVLARESSSDIPVWVGEEPGPEAESNTTKLAE